jgi:putative acetyltransferase
MREVTPSSWHIHLIDFDDPSDVAALTHLIEQHRLAMRATAPLESQHALDLSGLQQPHVRVWGLREAGVMIGCGALAALDATHAEVKSMRTDRAHLRRGVAASMLQHLITEAQASGFTQLSLETGSMDYFIAARALYSRHGFIECGPFADYIEDPNSVYMTLSLSAQTKP